MQGKMPIPKAVRERRAALAEIAKETKAALPGILQQLPHLDASSSENLSLDELPPLDPSQCPKFTVPGKSNIYGTRVVVVNQDTFDAAIAMPASVVAPQEGDMAIPENERRNTRVAVLNLASDKKPGGGWLNGSVAQEEALCYRSSLYLSLHKEYYPWSPLTAIYTPDVVIIRSSMREGHELFLGSGPSSTTSVITIPSSTAATTPNTSTTAPTTPRSLPVVSVISAAALRSPPLNDAKTGFKYNADRSLTKKKMRMVLRIAAREGHELLVLGAMGCGAFHNPPEDVAACWLDVLEEEEFRGGWFRGVWFAVLDKRGEGNGAVFERVLG
ncbi:uncharacterized protein BCR38DRAFT_465336, partial [Pseudomassariella vexata]